MDSTGNHGMEADLDGIVGFHRPAVRNAPGLKGEDGGSKPRQVRLREFGQCEGDVAGCVRGEGLPDRLREGGAVGIDHDEAEGELQREPVVYHPLDLKRVLLDQRAQLGGDGDGLPDRHPRVGTEQERDDDPGRHGNPVVLTDAEDGCPAAEGSRIGGDQHVVRNPGEEAGEIQGDGFLARDRYGLLRQAEALLGGDARFGDREQERNVLDFRVLDFLLPGCQFELRGDGDRDIAFDVEQDRRIEEIETDVPLQLVRQTGGEVTQGEGDLALAGIVERPFDLLAGDVPHDDGHMQLGVFGRLRMAVPGGARLGDGAGAAEFERGRHGQGVVGGVEAVRIQGELVERDGRRGRIAVSRRERGLDLDEPAGEIVAFKETAHVESQVRGDGPAGERAVGDGNGDFEAGFLAQAERLQGSELGRKARNADIKALRQVLELDRTGNRPAQVGFSPGVEGGVPGSGEQREIITDGEIAEPLEGSGPVDVPQLVEDETDGLSLVLDGAGPVFEWREERGHLLAHQVLDGQGTGLPQGERDVLPEERDVPPGRVEIIIVVGTCPACERDGDEQGYSDPGNGRNTFHVGTATVSGTNLHKKREVRARAP